MLYVVYSIVLFFLSVYSYSQIDLNLTLSSNSLYQYFQNQLIYLGYFNRGLSTFIYMFLLFLVSIFYFLILYLVKQQKLGVKKIAYLIIASCVILFFSYSAFSHDLFNYMFDARIVTRYYQNPYMYSALNFPFDLWTRFMHWTHRTYPYGPVWLLLTLPASYLGFGKFVLTLFNFKLLFTIFHLGNIYLIYKILPKISPGNTLLGIAFYAFNPLILIESLVSPHNEVTMIFFLLLAIYMMLIKKNYLTAIISLLFSAGIKFITIILLPLFIIPFVIPNKFSGLFKMLKHVKFLMKFQCKRVQHDTKDETQIWLKLILLFLIPPIIYEIYLREPYPWYFIPIIGISALLIKYKSIIILISGFALGTLLRYLPFLYTGEYSKPVRNTQDLIFIITILLTIGLTCFVIARKRSDDSSESML